MVGRVDREGREAGRVEVGPAVLADLGLGDEDVVADVGAFDLLSAPCGEADVAGGVAESVGVALGSCVIVRVAMFC